MAEGDSSSKAIGSDSELAETVARVAEAAGAHVIIGVTEKGSFPQRLQHYADRFRVIAATTARATYESLKEAGLETLRLPVQALDKHRQVRHVLSVALKSQSVSVGELVVCAVGRDVYPDEGNLIVVAEVEPGLEEVVITDLVQLTDGIRPRALECALMVACRIGRAARRGKRVGAIIMIGDSLKVLQGSKQLVPNPFQGHEKETRMLTRPQIHDALVELAKLDGAFVVRGDGFIQSAGVFLTSPDTEDIDLPPGLGARHAAAAAASVRTAATSIVVSATDGNVRVFSGGRMVLRMDPDIEHGPIHPEG